MKEAPKPPTANSQDQNQVNQAATTGRPSTGPVPLWKKVKQVCGRGPDVDSFEAYSFDDDAKALADDAASSSGSSDDGFLRGKGVGG